MRGNIKIVEHLVKEPGVKLDSRDKMGSTPLHIAGSTLANQNKVSICIDQLEHIVTEIYFIATYKNSEVVRILLEHNADFKLKDSQRQF